MKLTSRRRRKGIMNTGHTKNPIGLEVRRVYESDWFVLLITVVLSAESEESGDKASRKKHRRHHKTREGCRRQYIQSCTWPQCNGSCPKLQNPVTGECSDDSYLFASFFSFFSILNYEFFYFYFSIVLNIRSSSVRL